MTRKIGLVCILLIIILLAACSSAVENRPINLDEAVQAGVMATLTKEAWLEGVESARKTAVAAESQTGDDEDDGDSSSILPTFTPQPSLTPTLKPAAEHLQVPGKPKEKIDTYLTDFNSIDNADVGFTYGDNYKANIYERPFTAEEMDYRGVIDIIRVNLKVSTTWIYVSIFLAEDLPEIGEMKYGLELDLDVNGRGDYLIQSGLPLSSDWSVAGVQVYTDADGDVGGESPMFMDTPDPELNGYEVLVFDAGAGDDPDLAWVRRHPDEPNSLQFAFKYDLIGPTGFMWSAWADEGLRAPDYFDYNDRFTAERAGSPYPGSPLYPIKALDLVDNTCRSYYGFTPSGNELGLCPP